MAQVTYTTNDVIVNALYLIGELGVGETPDAFMLSTGLELINELLNKFSVDGIYIPYLTTLNFTMVVGQGTYTISDIILDPDIDSNRIVDIDFANYTVSSIVYPMRVINKTEYYDVIRLNNLQTRPAAIFLNKQSVESQIVIYPIPDQPYPCFIQVKSMLDNVSAFDTIIKLPPYYYGFLKYALARKFLSYYPSGNWPQQAEEEYQDYYANLKAGNEKNLSVIPSSLLTGPDPFYWQKILAYT